MATGSKASAALRLQEAHYRTGQGAQPGVLRCERCRHVDRLDGSKQHGRYCNLHRAAVKTHGICDAFGNPPPNGLAEADGAFIHQQLRVCLDVLLRMVPGYCSEMGVEQCTEAEHNEAIHRAAIAVHGPHASKWPKAVVDVISGKLE